MSPIVSIKNWYLSLEQELQADIGYFFSTTILNEDGFDNPSDRVIKWLDAVAVSQTYHQVGAAVTFRAFISYFISDRFREDGWATPERLFKSVIQEASEDKTRESTASRLAPSAFRMLRNLPDRKAKWIEAGQAWKVLLDSTLSDAAFNDYTFPGSQT
ncbi:hypothetical protein [Tardiphaga robiniae]|uniref:hypothetical protein n=1 Tax=Tardiphaga robiniae TaxID=943830 RepID=UPI0015861DA8|nr:hypothetical protein [Tardiphaga robiniae]NUU44377.1 hypothetical protein [Tardiphaga robiniae]